jgi:hypothetical protein
MDELCKLNCVDQLFKEIASDLLVELYYSRASDSDRSLRYFCLPSVQTEKSQMMNIALSRNYSKITDTGIFAGFFEFTFFLFYYSPFSPVRFAKLCELRRLLGVD